MRVFYSLASSSGPFSDRAARAWCVCNKHQLAKFMINRKMIEISRKKTWSFSSFGCFFRRSKVAVTTHDKAYAWVDGPRFRALAHRGDGFSPGLHAAAVRTPCSSSFADGFGRRV